MLYLKPRRDVKGCIRNQDAIYRDILGCIQVPPNLRNFCNLEKKKHGYDVITSEHYGICVKFP